MRDAGQPCGLFSDVFLYPFSIYIPREGITTSSIREFVIFENAPPIITPTAISITFPRAIKVLNSVRKPDALLKQTNSFIKTV